VAGDADFPDAKAGEPRKIQQLDIEGEPSMVRCGARVATASALSIL
jgi:hypothetical protein